MSYNPAGGGSVADGSITIAKLGGDITAAGTALLDDASASAQRTTMGAAATSHTHAASDLASGTVATARLGSGTANSTTFLRGDQTWATPAGGGSTATTVETTLAWGTEGRFTITDAAISGTSKVLCWQAPGPYTGKGTLADEAAMQPVQVVSVAPAAGTAVVSWATPALLVTRPTPTTAMLRGAGTDANSGTNRDPQFTARKIGKVRGAIKFSYLVLA